MKFGRFHWSLGMVVLLAAVGCGKSDAPPASVDGAGGGTTVSGSTQQPDVIVAQFLEAMRKGDDKVVLSLLTQKAREETSKNNLAVSSVGSPTSTYTLGQTEMDPQTPGVAQVGSIWTDKDPMSGQQFSYNAIWVVHLEKEGWRISGVGVQVSPDVAAEFYDFENAVDVAQKLEKHQTDIEQQDAAPLNADTRPLPGNPGGSPSTTLPPR